jgi:hypothetical protein
MRTDVAVEGTDMALECVTLGSAEAGGRCTPLNVIVLTLARGRGGCSCGCAAVLPIGLRAGTPSDIIVIFGFVFSPFVLFRAVDVDAGIGSADDIDGRMLFRLGRSAAGGGLLHLAVGAAGICILLFFGRRNWRTGAGGAALRDFV